MNTRITISIILALLGMLGCPGASGAVDWEGVSSSRDYICGEGSGSTVEEADRNAISDLMSRITMQVSLRTSQSESETASASGGVSSETSFRQVLDTYSTATLTNTEKFILSEAPEARVGRAIRRSEIDRMFAGREAKVRDLVAAALEAEKGGRVAAALKNLYWARVMLKTLRNPGQFSLKTPDGSEMLYSVFIPRKLDEILGNIRITTTGRRNDVLPLRFTYRGRSAEGLDYSCFDGLGWSSLISVRDGESSVALPPGVGIRNVKVRVEYEYRGEASMDPDISAVLVAFRAAPLRRAYFTVSALPADVCTPEPEMPDDGLRPDTAGQRTAPPAETQPLKKTPAKRTLRTSSGKNITPRELNQILNKNNLRPR